jgi:hypothetical protein
MCELIPPPYITDDALEQFEYEKQQFIKYLQQQALSEHNLEDWFFNTFILRKTPSEGMRCGINIIRDALCASCLPLFLPTMCVLHKVDESNKQQFIQNMVSQWNNNPQFKDESLMKMKHKYIFAHDIEEELIAYVCNPINYDRFEALGFFDDD